MKDGRSGEEYMVGQTRQVGESQVSVLRKIHCAAKRYTDKRVAGMYWLCPRLSGSE